MDTQRTAWANSVNDILKQLNPVDVSRYVCGVAMKLRTHSLGGQLCSRVRATATPGCWKSFPMLVSGYTFMRLDGQIDRVL
jgi:hypothetical protein